MAALILLLGPATLVASGEILAWHRGQVADPVGDHGALELYTRAAAEGRQMLGPYSRFCFHHPGPLYFYASVPLYLLCGKEYVGVRLTALLVNGLATLCMLRVAARGAGSVGFWTTAVTLAVFMVVRHPEWWMASWNPSVAVLPFGAMLFLFAEVASGTVRSIVAATLAASFVTQTHLATAAPVAALSLLASAMYGVPPFRSLMGLPPPAGGRSVRTLLVAVLVFVILWMLPIAEELGGGGNLRRLLDFAITSQGQHDFGEASVMVAQGVSSLLVGEIAPQAHDLSRRRSVELIALGVSTALVVSHIIARRHRDAFASALSSISLAGLATALLAATSAPGVLYSYLVSWTAMFGVAAAVVTTRSLMLAFDPGGRNHLHLRQPALWLASFVIILVAIWGLLLAARFARSPADSRALQRSEQLRMLATRTADVLKARGLLRPTIVVGDSDRHGEAIGFLLAIDKRGVSAAVQPFGCLDLAGRFAPNGTEDSRLILLGETLERAAKGRARLIGRGAGLVVYLDATRRPHRARVPHAG